MRRFSPPSARIYFSNHLDALNRHQPDAIYASFGDINKRGENMARLRNTQRRVAKSMSYKHSLISMSQLMIMTSRLATRKRRLLLF